jgi:nucleoid-associated protein YgaU
MTIDVNLKTVSIAVAAAVIIWQFDFIKTVVAWQFGMEPQSNRIDKMENITAMELEKDLTKELKTDGVKINKESINNLFSNLEEGIQQKKATPQKQESVSKKSYADLLSDEIEDNQDDDSSLSIADDGVESEIEDNQSLDYEEMLVAQMGDDVESKDALLKVKTAQNSSKDGKKDDAKCSTDTLLRGHLGKLLASAEDIVEQDLDSDNRVMNTTKRKEEGKETKIDISTSKQLLTDLLNKANCETNSSSNKYVSNILKEVATSKVKVMEVKDEYTSVMVKSGDTLSGLASRIYGDSRKYLIIYNANRDILSSPNKIFVGIVLKIPSKY